MRILWISNILFPQLAIKLNNKYGVGGGWMSSLADEIKDKVKLGVFSLYPQECYHKIDDIEFFTAPVVEKNYWFNLLSEFKPDIIHIHGTEYPHTLLIKQYSNRIPCVASIQGLVSVYARYALGGLSLKEIYHSFTIKDILKSSSPIDIQKQFIKNGKAETKLIKELKYIIGRTHWDYSHVKAINSDIKYFTCNECIRDDFYSGKWEYTNMRPHTIFCSNANVPLKGVHQVVKAMNIIKQRYPDVRLRIAGKKIIGKLSVKDSLRLSGYDNYLRHLITRYGLQDNITFLGSLSAAQMKEEFLRTNVFVLPSAIENSPNTLGEAQLLGTPVIASYVGGNMDMLPYPLNQLMYRFEEFELLAQRIMEVFEQRNWGDYTERSQSIARIRHNKQTIGNCILNIYHKILSND